MLTRSSGKRIEHSESNIISWRGVQTQFQKSIYNICVQVPECDIANIHLVFPTLKSLHLHFNKESENVRLIVGEDNGEGCSLQPKHENNLKEKIFMESDCRTLRSASGQSTRIGQGGEVTSNKRIIQKKVNCSICKTCLSGKPKKKVKNKSFMGNKYNSYHSLLKKDKKLTTAVVVLKDILRLNNRAAVKAERCPQNNEKEGKDVTVTVKQEISNGSNEMTTINNTSNSIDSTVVEKPLEGVNITKLAEGCNFSEILSRFRLEHVDCATVFNSSNYASPEQGEGELEQSEKSREGRLVVSENCELNFDRTDLGGEALEKREGLQILHVKEELEDYDIHENTTHDDAVQETESLTDQSQGFDTADDSECATAVQSSSGKGDEEIIRSSSLTPEVESQNCYVTEVYSNNSGNPKVLIRDIEKMKSEIPPKSNKNKNKKPEGRSIRKSVQANKLKKMESNEKRGKTRSKREKPMAADYIPLDAAGPTKFGVAMVNNIEPFRQHSAKDFRSKMLFGDRVKRYPSSTCLRTYKLKQEAACKEIDVWNCSSLQKAAVAFLAVQTAELCKVIPSMKKGQKMVLSAAGNCRALVLTAGLKLFSERNKYS